MIRINLTAELLEGYVMAYSKSGSHRWRKYYCACTCES